MGGLRQFYAYLQLLSLDVVLGALCSGMMAARLLAVDMPAYWYWVLPLSVWVIYTTDHLLDARRLGMAAHTERHQFHARHFRMIATLWGLALLVCMAYVPFIVDNRTFWFGAGMGVLVLGHLTLVWLIGDRIAWFIHKELGVGLIYAAGVWGGPMAQLQNAISPIYYVCAGQFFVLALINLLAFSTYEREVDTLDRQTSFVRAIGEGKTLILILLLALAVVFAGGYLWLAAERSAFLLRVQLIYALMLAVLLWLSIDPQRFRPYDRYRLWGDAVFLFPLLILWL